LILISAVVAVAVGLVMIAAVWAIDRQQAKIEDKAQRIFDVAMPMVFEATRMIRALERMARDGDSILWIDNIEERSERRHSLNSIMGDAALQGDAGKRALIEHSFAVLDQNLTDLGARGILARAPSLRRWEPVKLALFNASEGIGAEVSTAASDEADSILVSAQMARSVVMIAGVTLALLTTVLGLFLYLAFTRPIVQLAKSLKLVREGHDLSAGNVFVRELQVLNDAAVELARAHRELEVTRGQLEQMAHTDALTGLANRRMFELRGNEEFRRGRRYGERLAVVTFDVDNFKQINDRFSHDGGDAVLRALGGLLLASGRSADLPVARVGGEEFTMLLPHATLEMGCEAAQRIRQEVEQLQIDMPDGERIQVTASFGVADRRLEDTDLNALLHRADLALYQAKQGGRNRVEAAN
jgi:diguanylate cyclase (GGDEF)-like protein